ncbi:MAG: amino acid adenylation domain-containing protein [Bacteroidaceae bacterium]|nr:amino acid adenylation domain-containing protein [Bacteroidaceae bacterium]
MDWYVREYGEATDTESLPLADVYDNKDTGRKIHECSLAVGQEDVSRLSGRSEAGLCAVFASAFGFTLGNFVNDTHALFATVCRGDDGGQTSVTVPVYCDFSKTDTVGSLIRQVSEQVLSAAAKAPAPFEECCEQLGLNVQSCIVLTDKPCDSQSDDLCTEHQMFDLAVFVCPDADGTYKCTVRYPGDRYSDSLIARYCQTFNNVLCQMLVKDALADIDLLDEAQMEQVRGFNHTDVCPVCGKYRNIVALFRDTAKENPCDTAIDYDGKIISYGDLDRLTDVIATMISEKTEGKESNGVGLPVVAILLHRSENIATIPLASLKAGAAYQPLDPSYPQERLNFMVKDSDAKLLIADRDLMPLLDEYEGEVLLTDEIAAAVSSTNIAEDTLRHTEERLDEESAFVLLYTSGSTGVPKGVILEHGNLLSYCAFNHQNTHVTRESRIAAFASFGFDANMSDMYSALTCGAGLVIVPEEIRLDLDALADYFTAHGVTHALLTTQVGYQFATAFPEHPTLKVLEVGGEKLAALEPPTYTLYNLYGPTEGTVYATSKVVERRETNIPIGISNATVPCMIVSKYGKRLPVGAAGELVITGSQVSRGYLNRPDKTSEVFGVFGAKSYRTGDIVRYRENGDIEFVGRKDGQVKIRGFRVELKEVESVIREYGGIKDVTVQAFDLESGGKYIVAYVVSDEQVDVQGLNSFIASQKPPYMVPAITMQIDEIPLNVNQKVDKKKLPAPEACPAQNGGNATERDLNILEKQLVEITEGLIGNTPDIATPLTYCGLSSILSMRLAARIFKTYGVKLTSKELMAGATILSVEDLILTKVFDKDAEPDSNTTHAADGGGQTETFPLSFAQQGVYLDCQANPGTIIYNLPMEVRFPASVDARLLADTVKTVFEAHPILFAHFSENENGDSVQTLDAEKTADVPVMTTESEDSLKVIKRDFPRPFNLRDDRLFRAEVIIIQSTGEKVLLLDIHHLVCDGSSMDIIINQIIDSLKGSPVIKESYTYLDFSADQRHFADSREFTEHKDFFAGQLKDFEAVTDIMPDVSSDAPGRPREVAVEITDIDSRQCFGGNVTAAEFWLAATGYALGRFSNSSDVYFSTVSSGRQNIDIADTVGMFVNTLPVSVHIKNQTVRGYVEEVSCTFKAITDHENYPFSHIAADYGYSAGITFAYQLGLIGESRIDGQEVTSELFGLDTPKFRICIYIEVYDGKPSVVLEYDDSLYSESLIRSLAMSIVSTARNMIANADAPVRGLSMMSTEEMAAVCNVGKGDVLEYDQSLTLPDILRRQAVLTPDAIAVVFHDQSLTYKQLDDMTERLAAHLSAHGVGRETVTGIMIERSELMAVFPMAVMKAGGAYMPLDPEFPEDRLMFMCEDAKADIILSSDGLARKVMPGYKGLILEEHECKEIVAGTTANGDKPEGPLPSSLMVVLYTSGSTGKPKGVLLEQKSIVNFCHWYVRDFAMSGSDRCAAYANFGFDAHMIDFYPTYLAGATVHVLDADIRHDLVAMSEYINRHRLTISFMTTQICCQMATLFDLPTMRCMSAGGEKMPQITPPPFDFYNVYGPTECSLFSTFYKVTEPSFDGKIIGRPLANYQIYVVDSDRNVLPMGALGELLVEGRCVARGYLNRPDVNSDKFISGPVDKSSKAYRTGDQVRWNASGNIEFIGRMDGQVKLRGLRIELGEVDTVMSRFPSVRQAVAAVKEVSGSQHLCGYYVAKDGMTVSEDALKDFMRESLTGFMIPDFFVCLDAMPLTPNGKIDRKKLPAPESGSVQDYVEPRNGVERFFCDVVAQTLNLERVGATDDFFQIGGTSLIAMRLVVAVSKGGYNMVYKDLFDNPTPEAMARFVSGGTVGSGGNGNEEDTEITDYDYSRIDGVVGCNTLDTYLNDTSRHSLGNVFLTGATGYLGIHVLHELLEDSEIPAIYCLVRGNKKVSGLSRLRTLLYYYFDTAHKDQEGKRLFVIEGDVTKPFDYVDVHIDTVINCAANVKHFSSGTDIEDINIGGTLNCIDLCLRTGARLIHTSTGSVGGFTVSDDKRVKPHVLLENELYFGQNLDNKYARSKFVAERAVLEAIAERGLKAKIMRLGNLGPRSSDGEFQVNFHSNAFMGQLKAYNTLQAMPYTAMTEQTEFSPIDDAARAICLLSTTNDECTIFHVLNSHRPLYMDIIKCMNLSGYNILNTDERTFTAILQEALNDPAKTDILQSVLAYSSRSDEKFTITNSYASDYTTQVLLHLGFQWNMTTWDYMERFIQKITSFGFFDN